MKARRIGIILFFLAIAGAVGGLVREPLQMMTIRKVQVGDQVQGFTARTLTGQSVAVELAGRKTMLLFFKIDCPHCHRQLASTERFAQQYDGQGLQVIALSRADHEDLRPHPYSFKVLIDQSQAMVGRFGRVMVPTVALVDEAGVIRYIRSGVQSFEKDQNIVEAFMRGELNDQAHRTVRLDHDRYKGM